MSRNGQTTAPLETWPEFADTAAHLRRPWADGPARPVLWATRDTALDEEIDGHRHEHAQLLYASSGLMRVRTPVGAWVVPPQRAVWFPPGLMHAVTCVGPVSLRNIYVTASVDAPMASDCRVIAVSPLLRELILAVVALPRDYATDGSAGRLVGVLLDQIAAAPAAGLHLPLPRDRRLRVVTDALIADPADGLALDHWARRAGASARTLARIFHAETGLSFGAWRRQLRLHEALARLALGEDVTGVAFAVGYDSPSAFIAMFRAAMGSTPSRYFAKTGGDDDGPH